MRRKDRALCVLVAVLMMAVCVPETARASSPAIIGVSPIMGTVAGGTVVTVTGTGFAADARVTIGGFATLLMSGSATQIVVRTLPHYSGAADVTVTNGDGGFATLTRAFQFNRLPVTLNGAVQEFTVPTPNSTPEFITVGPDGALWFTEQSAARVGRITLTGAITDFPVGPGSLPNDIVAGPDGALWFTEFNGNRIGRMTTAGVLTNEYPLTLVNNAPKSPNRIALGPDGNLWFTESNGNNIGRITPAGAITEFAIPTPSSDPIGITTGSDGNIWFIESTGGQSGKGAIAQITPAGAITEHGFGTNSGWADLVAGAGGGVMFINPDGEYGWTNFPPVCGSAPVTSVFSVNANSVPKGIAAGSDAFGSVFACSGQAGIWFLEAGLGKIYRASSFADFPLVGLGTGLNGLVTGPDGELWFTERVTNKIGVLFSAAPTVSAITPPNVPASAIANVTITGLGFAPGATVTVGGTPATGVTVVNATTITAVAPAMPAGAVDVVVTNPGPVSSTPHTFSYGTINTLPGGKPGVPANGSPGTLPDGRPAGSTVGSPDPIPPPR